MTRTLVATSPSTQKNLVLETDDVVFNGEPRTMLIVEQVEDADDGDKLFEVTRFSLTVERIDALTARLAEHRQLLLKRK